jgi:hypothetical protein
MIPQSDDDKVDYKRLHVLAEEFFQLWTRIQGFYLDAAVGFSFVLNHVESGQVKARYFVSGTELDSVEFQDTRTFTYAKLLSDDFCTSGIHRATQGDVKARNSLNGSNYIILGQLCLTSFYDFWEEYLRREYAIAKGHLDPHEKDQKIIEQRLKDHASHDLWGDIKILRTSIVHNRGIAISDVAKCKIIKWFKPRDEIALTPVHMRGLFLVLLHYRNELFREHFPPRHFTIREY